MPFANFKVPAGTLTAEQKELIVHRATDLYAEIYGERARPNTMILVEEVPDGFTHAMLLRRGSVLSAGPIDEVFTAKNLSRCFGVQLEIEHRQSRWTARAR